MSQPRIVNELPALKPRDVWMHKGDAGSVFCLAGSAGMVGAAILTSRACLRSGAGLVKVGMPWRLAALVAGRDPNVMTTALPETEDGAISAVAPGKILEAIAGFGVVAAGPGLSRNAQTIQALRTLLPQVTQRLVIDADALNAISAREPEEILAKLQSGKGQAILTPHPGEMKRLLGQPDSKLDLQRDDKARARTAFDLARRFKVVVALKGYRTIVTDGERVYINATGNPGMAKAGMGDVLTGVIAALCAQGLESFQAAQLGVYLHGLSGDAARDQLGEWGIMASDVIELLPQAFLRHVKAAPAPERAHKPRKTQSQRIAPVRPPSGQFAAGA